MGTLVDRDLNASLQENMGVLLLCANVKCDVKFSLPGWFMFRETTCSVTTTALHGFVLCSRFTSRAQTAAAVDSTC